jgi:putative ABC transport system substrate-binding protein
MERFDRAMRQVGYVRGIHYISMTRTAEGRKDRLKSMAEELVGLKVDLIFTASTVAVAEAQKATSTIPIVFFGVADPVGAGFAESLARPGRNLTGLANFSRELAPKRLQLLKQMVPGLARVAVLHTPNPNPATARSLQTVADGLDLKLFLVEARAELAEAFQAMTAGQAQAIYVTADTVFWSRRQEIAQLALRSQFPTIFSFAEHVEAGGLMSYGDDQQDLVRQVAIYIDKIFKGAKPGDLPIEEPTKVDLVINRRTAEALHLHIPQQLLLQATRLIE